MLRHWPALCFLLILHPAQTFAQPPLLTVAERSDYKETSRHAEVVEYCQTLGRLSPLVRLGELGVTTEGRKLPLVILADPPIATAAEARKSGKMVVFAMGNIHAGEVDGKEALLMLMRDLARVKNHPLLKDLILVFVPNFNADGGDRIDKKNRTHQNGPPEVGIRPNAQGFDLNRDYIKLESPEVRALVRFFNEWDPAISVDTHTTNGSYHTYTITYDGPRHPAAYNKLVDYSRDFMLPELSRLLEKQSGYKASFYGNFEQGKTVWASYPAQPRYGTQYIGLRNRIGILSESYVYASYKDRVLSTRDFVLANFEFAAKHKVELQKLLQEAETHSGRPRVALRHKAVPVGKEMSIVGIEGGKNTPPGKAKEYTVTYLGKCEATVSVDRPKGYIVPQRFAKAIATIKNHGIIVEALKADAEYEIEGYNVDKITRQKKVYQDHNEVVVEVTPFKEKRLVAKGDCLLRCNQPLGTLAAFLLEPQSEDGLCTWNFFDEGLKQGAQYPVLRVLSP